MFLKPSIRLTDICSVGEHSHSMMFTFIAVASAVLHPRHATDLKSQEISVCNLHTEFSPKGRTELSRLVLLTEGGRLSTPRTASNSFTRGKSNSIGGTAHSHSGGGFVRFS